MSLVLDSSVTLARIFPDQWTPPILQLFQDLPLHHAWVPSLWKIEVANVLTVSVRRNRMTGSRRDQALVELTYLPIYIDNETDNRAWTDTLQLADRHNLTLYDATYLELALRRSLPLATLDSDLRKAAQAESIPLLGL